MVMCDVDHPLEENERMPRMIRKQIYVGSRQDTTLKKQARSLDTTEDEVIQQAIDQQMASVRLGSRWPEGVGTGERVHCKTEDSNRITCQP